MPLPIICFDMDGTLLNAQGHIHPNDAALLGSATRPALFIPATGRPVASLRGALNRNGLFAKEAIPLPLVLLNGSLLCGEHEVELAYHPLDESIQQELIALSRRFKHITFWFLSSTDIFVEWPNPMSDAMATGFDFRVLRPLAEANETCHFSKIMCVSDSSTALAELAEAVNNYPIESALSLPTVLELTPRNIDKGNGVTELFERLNLIRQPFYAAGDGENDLPLFRLARRSYATLSAPDSIKAASSQVIDVSREGLLGPILRNAG